MKRKAKQARSRQTVDIILTGALQVLKHRGYGNFTTERVAERAGVSVGSIYQYFENKDDILYQLYDREATKTLTAYAQIADQSWDDKRDQFKAFLLVGLGDKSSLDPQVFYEMKRVPTLQKKMADMSRELILITSQMIRQLQPETSSDDAKRLAELIVSTSEGMVQPLHVQYDSGLIKAYIEMAINFICKDDRAVSS